jgi:ketosteroid isomerase-like protein
MTEREQTERNRMAMTRALEAWRDSTAHIADVFATDMTWRIEGHSLASRTYSNKAEFIDKVLTPFAQRFTTSDPFRPVNIRGLFADGDTVIVLWDGRGTTIDNSIYENSYAWFLQMQDDQVIDGTAFYDSISFNSLWTNVVPARRSEI